MSDHRKFENKALWNPLLDIPSNIWLISLDARRQRQHTFIPDRAERGQNISAMSFSQRRGETSSTKANTQKTGDPELKIEFAGSPSNARVMGNGVCFKRVIMGSPSSVRVSQSCSACVRVGWMGL